MPAVAPAVVKEDSTSALSKQQIDLLKDARASCRTSLAGAGSNAEHREKAFRILVARIFDATIGQAQMDHGLRWLNEGSSPSLIRLWVYPLAGSESLSLDDCALLGSALQSETEHRIMLAGVAYQSHFAATRDGLDSLSRGQLNDRWMAIPESIRGTLEDFCESKARIDSSDYRKWRAGKKFKNDLDHDLRIRNALKESIRTHRRSGKAT